MLNTNPKYKDFREISIRNTKKFLKIARPDKNLDYIAEANPFILDNPLGLSATLWDIARKLDKKYRKPSLREALEQTVREFNEFPLWKQLFLRGNRSR